jgi:methylase of polypeptide subunit release factors
VKIWPSTHFLIQDLLKRKDQFANKALLELGSGTGIAGLVLSSVAGRVVLSDGNIDTIESLKQNVERNQGMPK